MARILIVEDDPAIRYGLEETLTAAGHEVATCETGDSRVEAVLAAFPADLVVLDVMLPGRSGYDVCRDLRRSGWTAPVLMLTAKGREIDKVAGLECGADDYVTKPFGIRELLARVQALLRRATEFNVPPGPPPVGPFRIGEALVDPGNHRISHPDREERLTPRECSLLVYLHRNPGRLLSRDELLRNVWRMCSAVNTRTLDQTVAQLRRKLGDSASSPRWLVTVHGVGYRLDP